MNSKINHIFSTKVFDKNMAIKKNILISAVTVGTCIGIAMIFILLFLKSRLPIIDGTVEVAGPSRPVTILTDQSGIPHIKASDMKDLYFGLGYVHARDRLFQMAFFRRIALGRLAEIIGEKGLRYDKLMRTLDFVEMGEAVLKNIDAEGKKLGKNYLKGINTYIQENKGRFPVEFMLLGFEPEEWSETDLLAYTHLLLWRMSYNYKSEMLFARIQKKVGRRMTTELLPFYPNGSPTLTSGNHEESIAFPKLYSFIDSLDLLGPPGGSNNWVINGSRTESGEPIFVEDPHDHGSPVPSTFHFVHLIAPDLNIIGACAPGLPFFQHAYNQHIAYGSTTTGSDSQDLFIEKINPDNPNEYLFQGNWRSMKIASETICVKDKTFPTGFRDEILTVRQTHHGPVLKDTGKDTALAIKWFAFDHRTISGMLNMSLARNCEDFISAGKEYVSGSTQNFLCADRSGNIVYTCLGWLPDRKQKKSTTWFPVPGWNGENEWMEGISGASLPTKRNPNDGFIATANNRVASESAPYLAAGKFAPHYRYSRIVKLLESNTKVSIKDVEKMLGDTKSLLAEKLIPILTDALADSKHPRAKEAHGYLSCWNYQMTPESVAATLYHQIFLETMVLTFVDQLGKKLTYQYLQQGYLALDRWVFFFEKEGGRRWFDDITTPEKETRLEILYRGFEQAISKLEKRLGNKMSNWRWNKVHSIEFNHRPMAKGGWLMINLFNLGPFPFLGDAETINRGSYDIKKPFTVKTASSFRFAIDFSQPETAFLVQSTGQAEQLFSPFRSNHVKPFLEGRLLPIELDLEKIKNDAAGILLLEPQK